MWKADSRGTEEEHEMCPNEKSAMWCEISCFFCSTHMCYSFLLSTVNLSEQLPAGENINNVVLVLYFLALPLFRDCAWVVNEEMFRVLGLSLFFPHSVCYLSCKSTLKNHGISWVGITTIIKSNFWISLCWQSQNASCTSLFTDGFQGRWGERVQLGFQGCLKSVPTAAMDLVQ